MTPNVAKVFNDTLLRNVRVLFGGYLMGFCRSFISPSFTCIAGEVKMNVGVDEYMDKIVDMCNIKISVMARVVETKQFYCESDDFRLCKPDLTVEVRF